MAKILIVDDDVRLGNALSEELKFSGFEVDYVSHADDAFRYLETNKIDVMLLDLKMPDKDGFHVLHEVKEKKYDFKVIVLTAYADIKSAIEAAKLSASDFLSKPYDYDELLKTIDKVLQAG